LKMSEQDVRMRVTKARERLFAAREKRVHPHKDDKILTDWNGLMVAALAKAARTFDDPGYAGVAEVCVDFILKNMCDRGGRLFHRYRDGEAAITAYIDDYAFLTWGLLELYETTFDAGYIQAALELNKIMFEHFWDEQNGGFYFTPDDGEDLIVRSKEVYDGAVPSGNSVAMLNLLRLGRITAESDLEEAAARIERAFSTGVRQSPSAHTQLMVAIDFGRGPSYEVVVAGDSKAEDTKAMLKSVRARFIPNKVVLLRPSEQESPDVIRVAPFTEGQTSIDGKATAYVCRDYVCKFPTTDVGKMLELLNKQR
ncbi:MAG: thioredoxin, partial [candidate division Zixibacteria bacterium DG_27]